MKHFVSGAAEYCKHGKYVGGCGADLMCGPCEMGDPDVTINELHTELVDKAHKAAQRIARFRAIGLTDDVIDGLIQIEVRDVDRARQHISEVRRWATNETDDDWMRRRHQAAIDGEYRAWLAEQVADVLWPFFGPYWSNRERTAEVFIDQLGPAAIHSMLEVI